MQKFIALTDINGNTVHISVPNITAIYVAETGKTRVQTNGGGWFEIEETVDRVLSLASVG